jgi:predicted transcriptional regulator
VRLPQPLNAQSVLAAISAGDNNSASIMQTTGLTRIQVTDAVRKLRGRGYVEIPKPGNYRITDAGRTWLTTGKAIVSGQGAKKPRPASGLRQRAWWLMTKDKTFTLDGLLYTVATGTERDAEDNLRRYLNALERTGFIARIQERRGSGSKTAITWRINADRLSRKAPIFRQRHQQVVCSKTGTVYPIEKGEAHE